MRLAMASALALVLLPLTAGCGHGQGYCEKVTAHQSELGSIAGDGDRTALLQALPILEDLEGSAPDDVAEDWQLLVTRIRALETTLRNADVDPATYDPSHPPADLSDTDVAAIRRAAAQLAATDTRGAISQVQQEVLDVCHTPLEL